MIRLLRFASCWLLGHREIEVEELSFVHPLTRARVFTGFSVCTRCGRCR